MKFMNILIILFISLLILSCTDDENPLRPNERELPPLEDDIPYDFLGSGKILFERIGPGGYYEGFYVVDIDNQQSWGLQGGSNPCISNDGSKIAFTHYSGLETAFDVHIMDLDGNNKKRISNFPDQDRCPAWNDDGTLIVFWGGWITYSIFTLDPDGLNMTTIRSYNVNYGLRYSDPSGRMTISKDKIVYAANNGPNTDGLTSGLCMLNIDGSDFQILMYSPKAHLVESPSFSPGGNFLAYISVGFDPNTLGGDTIRVVETMQIHLLDMTDKSSTVIYESDIVENNWSDPGMDISVFLCWSPDGTKILFSKPVAELISYLYAINKDGSQLTQVTSLEGVTDRHISWSK